MANEQLIDKLKDLIEYYYTNRGEGHTLALINGAKNTRGAIILTHNSSMSNRLKREHNVESMSIQAFHSAGRLRGTMNRPLLIDNGALMMLLDEVLSALSEGLR